MTITKLDPAWYVLHTKSRFENIVNDGLIKKSMDSFLPKIKIRSKRRDRKLMIRTPLFPGYLFVKTDLRPDRHLDILKTAGAVRLLGTREGPVPVPGKTIESLKLMVDAREAVSTGKRLKKGARVMVMAGPFAGVIGAFVRYRGKRRVVVNVEALGQWASVDVREEDIEPMPEILV